MYKKIAVVSAALMAAFLALAATVVGYMDMQQRSTPGNPSSGYLRIWATSGTVKCVQSTGSACLFDSASSAHAIGMAFGESGGSPISTGSVFVVMPFACTVQSTWYAYSDQTVTFDIKKNGSTIVSGGAPSAAAGSNSGSTSGWTTSISAGDVIEWKLLSVTSSPSTASITLGCN
jgi:hypothetical protein